MDAREMLDRLDAVEKRRNAEKKADADSATAQMVADGREVALLLSELADLVPVVTRLFQLGLVKFEYCSWFNAFQTDGVNHRWGFSPRCPDLFGKRAGGCCGDDDLFVNVRTGMWSTREEALSMPLDKFAARYNGSRFVRENMHVMASGIRDYIEMVGREVERIK